MPDKRPFKIVKCPNCEAVLKTYGKKRFTHCNINHDTDSCIYGNHTLQSEGDVYPKAPNVMDEKVSLAEKTVLNAEHRGEANKEEELSLNDIVDDGIEKNFKCSNCDAELNGTEKVCYNCGDELN